MSIFRTYPSSIAVTLALPLFLLTGCQSGNPQGTPATSAGQEDQHLDPEMLAKMEQDSQLVAHLSGTSLRPRVSGVLQVTPTEGGVSIQGKVRNLKPNSKHGFHVHQYGDCSADDATSAGGHYNPGDHPHELPPAKHRHAGDLGNITTDSRGVAEVSITSDTLSLIQGKYPLVGRAFVVHTDADTGKGEAGEAGARIACGVIGFTQQ